MLCTRENTDFFHRTRFNIFGIHLKKSKYPLYILSWYSLFTKVRVSGFSDLQRVKELANFNFPTHTVVVSQYLKL